MNNLWGKIAILSVMGCALAYFGCEKAPGQVSTLRIATGGTTGTYYAYGLALGKIVQEQLGLPVTVVPTAASVANIALIHKGAAELAFVQNDVMTYAYSGTNLFAGAGPQKDFAAIAGLYGEACQVIAEEGITSISALKGKRVSTGENGSGTMLNAAQIFEVFGMNFADITEVNLSFGDSAQAFQDGSIDAFFCMAGTPTPAIAELAARIPLNILPIGDARTRFLISNYPYYVAQRIPAGTYQGMTDDVMTVAVRATLIASTKLSEDDVYDLTKLLFENTTNHAAHPKAAELSLRSAVSGIPIPFHKGALRYYREEGILK
ncbi:MAG: TAXI family TRAP transporter solute-binding subunit [Spirochaetaceae bacterium]|nr:TAXI family TRAP transporter solute-binding subunit [Spirochaetaceae bacterium]